MRSLTVTGIGLMLGWGIIALANQLVAANETHLVAYGIPVVLAALFSWGLFRIYNWPRFADFLIATEAEMGKVSWSSKEELKRATAVVLLTLFLLAGFLLSVDVVWSWFLGKIGVLQQVKKTTEQASMDLNVPRIILVDHDPAGRSSESSETPTPIS